VRGLLLGLGVLDASRLLDCEPDHGYHEAEQRSDRGTEPLTAREDHLMRLKKAMMVPPMIMRWVTRWIPDFTPECILPSFA
jgi:hypothetical protein